MTKVDYGCAIERPTHSFSIAFKAALKCVAFAMLSFVILVSVCGLVILCLQASKP